MGHPIGAVINDWYYIDTGEKCDNSRSCVKCGLFATEDGHDPCIANLEGVRNACCGHGVEDGYIQFNDRTVIRGVFDHLRHPHLKRFKE